MTSCTSMLGDIWRPISSAASTCFTAYTLLSFFVSLEPRVEWYKGLRAWNTSPPRNCCTIMWSSCSSIERDGRRARARRVLGILHVGVSYSYISPLRAEDAQGTPIQRHMSPVFQYTKCDTSPSILGDIWHPDPEQDGGRAQALRVLGNPRSGFTAAKKNIRQQKDALNWIFCHNAFPVLQGRTRTTKGPSWGYPVDAGGRSWSHFVGIYRQKLSRSSKIDFWMRFEGPGVARPGSVRVKLGSSLLFVC